MKKKEADGERKTFSETSKKKTDFQSMRRSQQCYKCRFYNSTKYDGMEHKLHLANI